ncbi:MAG: preprotein translocase subunit SecE [Actinobacteria bacterium]|nr:preprotein translocase subunit SecE [Actinomycetota bacterium]MCB9411988.1 preprotein translocase subunit SecE [Actinomycetota bacterium]
MTTADDADAEGEKAGRDGAQGATPDSTPDAKPAKGAGKKKSSVEREGIFARFAKFLRQVVAELRKVIWPTRSELINYASVVLVFVVIMAAILAAYDFAFARAVFFVFGE